MEIVTILGVCLLGVFYLAEAGARKGTRLGRYAWLAHALHLLLFPLVMGLWLRGFILNEWQSSLWGWIAAVLSILVGVALTIRTVLNRRDVQRDFESGKKQPCIGVG